MKKEERGIQCTGNFKRWKSSKTIVKRIQRSLWKREENPPRRRPKLHETQKRSPTLLTLHIRSETSRGHSPPSPIGVRPETNSGERTNRKILKGKLEKDRGRTEGILVKVFFYGQILMSETQTKTPWTGLYRQQESPLLQEQNIRYVYTNIRRRLFLVLS